MFLHHKSWNHKGQQEWEWFKHIVTQLLACNKSNCILFDNIMKYKQLLSVFVFTLLYKVRLLITNWLRKVNIYKWLLIKILCFFFVDTGWDREAIKWNNCPNVTIFITWCKFIFYYLIKLSGFMAKQNKVTDKMVKVS